MPKKLYKLKILSVSNVGVIASLLCVCVSLGGCTSKHFAKTSVKTLQSLRLHQQFHVDRSAPWVVHATTSVHLAMPAKLDDANRRRHLLSLYNALHLRLQQGFPAYSSGSAENDLSDAFRVALADNKQLLFWPRLVETTNRLNTMSEIIEGKGLHPEANYGNDTAVFQVLIYDVQTQALIDVATVFSRSRFFDKAQNSAMSLLDKAAEHYLMAITGQRAS